MYLYIEIAVLDLLIRAYEQSLN